MKFIRARLCWLLGHEGFIPYDSWRIAQVQCKHCHKFVFDKKG
jgi:hypothetical protein